MRAYLNRTPGFIMRFFSKYIWRFSLDKKEVYLTFDDDPTPEITAFVLDELKKYNAKATFFCIGKNVQKHPQIFKRILMEAHSVGNHTQQHLNGWKHTTKSYIDAVFECQRNLVNFNGTNGTLKSFDTLQ